MKSYMRNVCSCSGIFPYSLRSTHYYIEGVWTLHALGRYDSSLRTYNFVPPDSLLAGNFRNDYFDLLFKTNSFKALREHLDKSSVEDDSAKHRYVCKSWADAATIRSEKYWQSSN